MSSDRLISAKSHALNFDDEKIKLQIAKKYLT